MEGSAFTSGDLALMNHDGFGGNNGAFWIFALLLLANGSFGFGGYGNRGGEQYATTADVQRGFDTSEITRKLDGLANGIADATYALNNDITNEGRAIQMQTANGFCETQRNIDGLRYEMANHFAQTDSHATDLYMKLHDEIAQNKIESLQGQISQLQLQNAMCGVVRYPNQLTYNAGNLFANTNGCGCGYNAI